MKNATQMINEMILEELEKETETTMDEIYAVLDMSSDMAEVDTFLRNEFLTQN